MVAADLLPEAIDEGSVRTVANSSHRLRGPNDWLAADRACLVNLRLFRTGIVAGADGGGLGVHNDVCMNESSQQTVRCVDAIAAVNCTLQAAIGRFERCPGSSCPLWDDGECLFEETKSELLDHAYVAEHLLELRDSLAAMRRAELKSGFRSPLWRVVKERVFEVHRSLVPLRDG